MLRVNRLFWSFHQPWFIIENTRIRSIYILLLFWNWLEIILSLLILKCMRQHMFWCCPNINRFFALEYPKCTYGNSAFQGQLTMPLSARDIFLGSDAFVTSSAGAKAGGDRPWKLILAHWSCALAFMSHLLLAWEVWASGRMNLSVGT